MRLKATYLAALALLAGWPEPGRGEVTGEQAPASRQVVAAIAEPSLRELVEEVLGRNPGVAAAAARARAAAERVPQVRALPDPVATLTGFVLTPETRTGPQRLSAGFAQGLPWFGKLALREQAALDEAAALAAEVEARRLELVTETRRLYYELAFLDRHQAITEEFRRHLLQHEEISRARYSTGVGPGQSVVKLQAAITRVERDLMDLETRRVAIAAQVNGLRDRPAATVLSRLTLPEPVERPLDPIASMGLALRFRPEMNAAEARISRAQALVRLAERGYRPDFTVGLTYTVVDPRDDLGGRLQPPAGNGDDVLGIQAGIALPIRRKKLASGVREAELLRLAAEEARREVIAAIEAAVGDLTRRVPLGWRQLRLVEDLLIVQAEEALESAQAGYVAGTLNALDLLDAEHVLFDARTALARVQTDYLVGLARLEGAVGRPLQAIMEEEPRS